MQMEYSAADIGAARDLQFLAYIYISTATFWTYDFVCSLHEEWTFLLRSRWTKVKGLYIITRYIPFVVIFLELWLSLAKNEPKNCQILSNIFAYFGVISLALSEFFFVLRTYALWNNKRIVLVAVLSGYFAVIISCIGILAPAGPFPDATIGPVQGVQGCSQSPQGFQLFLPFVLVFVFQVGLICLTITRAIQRWRLVKGPLFAILVKHNIFYYACGLLFSAMNFLLPLLLGDMFAVYSAIEAFQILILAILATRMHLHLWHAEQYVNGSEGLVYISLSDMQPVNGAA
ncbi:uncharacterized protein BJ212DRAFT_620048 [Suillus subaureus]|uniref:DUF6533 domain-containing protein n=1 Tax=Suillus subaureus TaxID=48587 RepID=A0A9P7E1X1_9AGAM|nr:uncharacterized protein BJ212DRAFT_620048 [Suillus subaureus]KAG1809172.1 hypothetical protein BJ212DRAFT_620048 [Suillus subaureus]